MLACVRGLKPYTHCGRGSYPFSFVAKIGRGEGCVYWEGKGLVGEGVEGRASPMHGDKARPVQFKMVSVRSGKPIRAPPNLSEVSPTLPFETVPVFV